MANRVSNFPVAITAWWLPLGLGFATFGASQARPGREGPRDHDPGREPPGDLERLSIRGEARVDGLVFSFPALLDAADRSREPAR